jgi:hypothetical protein
VWEVYGDADTSDWIYANDALMVVYAHTGCDVRGGYAYPLFLNSSGDYSIPIDLVAGYSITECRKNGEKLEYDEYEQLDEKWQVGYSSNPSYQLSKDIKRVFEFTKTTDSVVVELESGEIVKIAAFVNTY